MTAPQSFTRARLQLLGHVDLGVVSCRLLPCGSVELDNGTRYGAGALYCYTPVTPQAPISADEMTAAMHALGGATACDTEVDGPRRWRVALPERDGMCLGATFLEAYSSAVEAVRAGLEGANAALRAAHEEVCTDERARRAEQLLQAMERIEKDGLPATIFCASGMGSGRWTLDICEEAPVGGTLDEMVNAILNRAPAETPPPAADAAPKPSGSDDDIPF